MAKRLQVRDHLMMKVVYDRLDDLISLWLREMKDEMPFDEFLLSVSDDSVFSLGNRVLLHSFRRVVRLLIDCWQDDCLRVTPFDIWLVSRKHDFTEKNIKKEV